MFLDNTQLYEYMLANRHILNKYKEYHIRTMGKVHKHVTKKSLKDISCYIFLSWFDDVRINSSDIIITIIVEVPKKYRWFDNIEDSYKYEVALQFFSDNNIIPKPWYKFQWYEILSWKHNRENWDWWMYESFDDFCNEEWYTKKEYLQSSDYSIFNMSMFTKYNACIYNNIF